MKKSIIFYTIFISLFLTNFAKAELEKGKWNFISIYLEIMVLKE